MQRPLFSIVMPTRNRAHLLQYSLQTALEQTFDEYEIIISDNKSSDDTSRVVRELANTRVHYVRTDRSLTRPDSYEFAVRHAQGEYIVFLFDDDALCLDTLGRVAQVARSQQVPVVGWERAYYHHPDWDESGRVNTLEFSPFDRKVVQMNSRSVLRSLYATDRKEMYAFPQLAAAAFHRDIIDDIRRQNSRLFQQGIPEDVSFGIAVLTQADSLLHIHEVLSLFGKHTDGFGYSLYYQNREQRLVSDYATDDFRLVPFKSVTLVNFIFETLLRMKEIMPDALRGYDPDWKHYFIGCYNDLMALEMHGVDVSEELREFDTVLSQQPPDLREWIGAAIIYLRSQKTPSPSRLRRLIKRFSLLEGLELSLLPESRASKNLVIRGEEVGFHNILECAQFFNPSLREQLVRFWSGQRHTLPVRGRVLQANPARFAWGSEIA